MSEKTFCDLTVYEEGTPMKHIFILNPAAGKGKPLAVFEDKLCKICAEKEVSFDIYRTKAVGDAFRFVRETCLSDTKTPLRFYACGGDGTIGEVVGGTVGFENAEVAIVPMGTGNDFARFLGKKEIFLNIENQIDAIAYPCDVIRWNEDRYCINMMNIGFDGEVAARASRTKRFFPGKFAYICGVALEFFKMTKAKFRFIVDGRDLGIKKILLSLYAHGGFCGGGFFAAPYADLHDGKMDICLIRPVSRFTFLGLVGSYRKGTHMLHKKADKYFEYYKCSDLRLEFEKPQRVCVDGEIEECLSLHLEVLGGAVRLVLPAGAETPKSSDSPLIIETV